MSAAGWTITEKGFNPQTHKAWEGLFTLGAPGLHIRGSLEEPIRGAPQAQRYWRAPGNVTAETFRETISKWGTLIPGVYGPHPTLNSELINMPWGLALAAVVDGERLDVATSQILEHERTLDMRRALLRRRIVWRTSRGTQVTIEHERFVHHDRAGLLAQRMTVEADREAQVVVEAAIDARVTTNGYDHFTGAAMQANAETSSCRVQTDGSADVHIASRLSGSGDPLEPLTEPRAVTLRRRIRLRPGERATFDKLTRYHTGEVPAPAIAGPDDSYESLLAGHTASWARRWESCDIEIDGDEQSQLAVRVSLFHLLRAHPGAASALAIDAKGYAGEAYWGRFFWDTEIFLLPFFLYTDPERARALVDFRLRTLDAARYNAQARGQAGARFPWEADGAGRECCPNFQYADHEVHITADVAFGAAHLAAASGDEGDGARIRELLIETGRFWMSRIDRRPGDDLPHLLGVMGPDEYTPISNDNAYTNRLARLNLEFAADSLEATGDPDAGAEAARMRQTGAMLPFVHGPGGLILQCEGFDHLADPRFDELWRDRSRPFAANVPQELLYRTRCPKQADVLMLMALFSHEFTDEQVRAAWDYYLPITTHDSSLSPAVHALVALRLGLDDEAWRFWQRGSGLDLDVAHGGAAEGIHIAAAGGVWQMVVYGFAGLRPALWSEALSLAPRLPEAWGRLAFPLVWRGQRAQVTIDGACARIENRSDRPLAVEVSGESRTIAPADFAKFPIGASARTGGTPVPPAQPAPAPVPGGTGVSPVTDGESRPIEAIIFDLDGVLVTTDELHYRGWKAIADAEGIPFTREDNHRLRGVSRMESLDILLEKAQRPYSDDEKRQLAERKNAIYVQSLASLGPGALLPGAPETLRALRARGIKVAVASSSRNARTIIDRLGFGPLLDVIVDGADAARSKPAPDLFLTAAERLGAEPAACIVIEDATAGVEAAVAAGMAVIAVGAAAGDPRALRSAPSLAELDPGAIIAANARMSE
ncbi:MAG: beta-phosphoglucomutase [Phycisphaerales bacterium JB039]